MYRELNDAIYGGVEVQKFQEAMEGGIPFRYRHRVSKLLVTGDR
jgi:hypothetical protein